MAVEMNVVKDMKLESPILIEGLPGIGKVGAISAAQLIEQLDVEKYAEIKSDRFPAQVAINNEGVIESTKNELYAYKAKEEGERDLLILTGNAQGANMEGRHEISKSIIDKASELGAEFIYTLGGYATNQVKDEPDVYGAVTHSDLKEELEEHGVQFDKRGMIAGAAGLLLEYGKRKGMKGVCLMGQTHGKFVDPNAAKQVLKVLEKPLELEIDYEDLDNKAGEMKKAIQELIKNQQQAQSTDQAGAKDPSDAATDYIH